MPSDPPEPPVSVFARHVEVLALIADSPTPPRFAQLLAQTGLSKATLHRILGALQATGMAVQDPVSQGWKPGLRLIGFASRAWSGLDLRRAAEEETAALRDATRETIRLSVLQGTEMLYLDQKDCPEPVSLRLGIGARGPAYCSGTGKAILAFLKPERLAAILDAITLARHTPLTITDRAALEADLAATRARGYALDRGEQAAEVRSLGVPVLNSAGEPVAAISVTVPVFRRSEAELVALAPLARQAAARIALRLPPGLPAAG
jgi:DNA-binding IclR family transcriptional regulator